MQTKDISNYFTHNSYVIVSRCVTLSPTKLRVLQNLVLQYIALLCLQPLRIIPAFVRED